MSYRLHNHNHNHSNSNNNNTKRKRKCFRTIQKGKGSIPRSNSSSGVASLTCWKGSRTGRSGNTNTLALYHHTYEHAVSLSKKESSTCLFFLSRPFTVPICPIV